MLLVKYLATVIVVAVLLWITFTTLGRTVNANTAPSVARFHRIIQTVSFVMITVLFAMIAISSGNQPKRVIEVPQNREQLQYDAPKDVTITPSTPRTERMDQFKPMGSD